MMCPVFYTHTRFFYFLFFFVYDNLLCIFFFFPSNRHLEQDMITAELYKPASDYVK